VLLTVSRFVILMLLAATASRAFAQDGEALFNGTCAACHQRGGVGSPGLAPPLVDKPLWNRLGTSAPAYLQGVMLSGMSGHLEVEGEEIVGLVMPPQERISDAELAAIGNYILGILNAMPGTALTAETVARVRAAPPTHTALRAIRKGGV
jgi:mono/diheme cytochrome c family protein